VLEKLQNNGQAWLATASRDGKPRLIAVSFWWTGRELVISTRTATPTGRNLHETRSARLAIGSQEDVIMIDAEATEEVVAATATADLRQGFIKAAGFDPAEEGSDWAFFRLRPYQVEAYRGYGELEGRVVMRHGEWRA
jgi:hypothetical protein